MLKTLIGFSSVLILILFLSPITVHAEQKGSLEITPAFSEVVLDEPSQEQKIEITFINHGTKTVNLEVFPIDFKQSGEFGEISFLNQQPGSYSYSLSSFLSLEQNQLELKGGEKTVFKVTIKNREDISPGGHYAAVVGKVVDTANDSTSAAIAPSLASLILLRKTGGERFNLSLVDVAYPSGLVRFDYPSLFNIKFQNEGNIHLIPYGRVEIKDMFGRLIYQGTVNPPSHIVFPETTRQIRAELIPIENSLPISLNTLEIKGQDSIKKVNYSFHETYLYINPALLLGLIGILAIISFIIKNRNQDKK